MLIGYARTSTDDQKAGLEAQIKDLEATGCAQVCSEHISSVADHRPALEGILFCIQAGDTLVVTKLDRLARSTIGMWQIVQRLEDKGAYLRILSLGGETVDTKGATGKLILTIFAGFAQFEREMMLERQIPGIAKAKANGKFVGRPRKTQATAKKHEIMKLHQEGMSHREISERLEIGRGAVWRAIGRGAA